MSECHECLCRFTHALAATEITLKHSEFLDKETTDTIQWHRQHNENLRIHFVQEVEDSIRLNHTRSGAIIISANGMCNAGRIKYHPNITCPDLNAVFCLLAFGQ